MNSDRDPRRGRVALPGSSASDPEERTVQARNEGLRRVRRMSNWTAAALLVGTGAAAVALAHQVVPVAAPASPTATAGAATAGTGAATATKGTGGPQVSHSVATTSASGVTTTTTTQVVNGKPVVTQVRHVPARHDD